MGGRMVRFMVVCAVGPVLLTGCGGGGGVASGGPTSDVSAPASGWTTPQQVLDDLAAAGLPCVLPSDDPLGQVLTTDPVTGEDLGGHVLVRCPDFQVMLASGSVAGGFARLVSCQDVPASVRSSAAWATPVVVGSTFLILPADLSAGWSTEPATFIDAFGGTTATFGSLYDLACGAVVSPSSGASPSGGTGSGAAPSLPAWAIVPSTPAP